MSDHLTCKHCGVTLGDPATWESNIPPGEVTCPVCGRVNEVGTLESEALSEFADASVMRERLAAIVRYCDAVDEIYGPSCLASMAMVKAIAEGKNA